MMWLKQLFSRRRLYNDLSEEIQEHLEEKIEELVASGMSRKEAAHAARREFGNVPLVEERSREVWQWPSIKDFLMDLRFGLRMLVKNWKQASIAAFSLSVAMALSVAGLSVFNGIMLRPPVATAPDRLVTIYTASPTSEVDGVSYPDYRYYRDSNHSFSAV